MTPWKIAVEPGSFSKDEVLEHLAAMDFAGNSIDIELPRSPRTFRSGDPAIIVAIIGAVGANLAVLISGLFQLRTTRKEQRISIELPSGKKVDVPADMPHNELIRFLDSLDEKPKRLILP
jgi:hypothetical protein